MGDLFSQNTINEALLKKSPTGNNGPENYSFRNNEKKIKNYDFKMPQKFTKEDLKLIRDIYEVYARLVATYLTSITRLYCHASVSNIREQKYHEFSDTLSEYTINGIVNLGIDNPDIMDAECTIQFSNELTSSLIDRMMGGQGVPLETQRDFTEIEVALMKSILERFASHLQEAWSGYIDISPTLSKIETNSKLTKSIGPEEVTVTATLDVILEKNKSTITINIPAVTMEEIMLHFSRRYVRTSKRTVDEVQKNEQRNNILKGVRNSTLTLNAVLAETRIDLSDILSLQVNDIIPLDVPITQNAIIKINNVHWFNAKPGVSGNKKAIKIIDVCDSTEGDEENAEQ
ncbi:MAG: flagellar motor switch protein FliM [Oscillospiraceae bacterium]|nr:flagellar motor switch protein FliM [Oscillospiraceae bacterium]